MKIICIGRNYREHAHELNNPIPDEPIIFMKPETALLKHNAPFLHPHFSNDIHHEIEIVFRVDASGKNVDAVGLGIDFTARDIQEDCKKKGLPWEKAKAFDQSAPISELISREKFADVNQLQFHFEINGKTVQNGNTRDMIFSIDTLLKIIPRYFTLQPGDLIFTGTPSGVGPVRRGDVLTGYIENQKMIEMRVI